MKEKNKKKELILKFLTTSYTPLAYNLKESELKNNIELTGENKDQKIKTNIKFLTRKKLYFDIKSTNKKKSLKNSNFNNGRWKKDEHNQFLQGIALYGNNWKKIKSLIRTRTATQVRSHAQKFFNKAKLFKDDNLGIDFTLNSIHDFNDMLKQIKHINPNYNIVNIFKKLYFKTENKINYKEPKNNYNNNNNDEKDKNSSFRNEGQKELIIQDNEKKYLDNNQILINENNNNLHYNISYDSNNSFDLNVNKNFLFNYILNYNTNSLIFNLCNDCISMNRISLSIINSLNQINNIFFSLRIQNNIINPDNRFKELAIPNQIPSINIDNNSIDSPGNKLFQINNNNNTTINSIEK